MGHGFHSYVSLPEGIHGDSDKHDLHSINNAWWYFGVFGNCIINHNNSRSITRTWKVNRENEDKPVKLGRVKSRWGIHQPKGGFGAKSLGIYENLTEKWETPFRKPMNSAWFCWWQLSMEPEFEQHPTNRTNNLQGYLHNVGPPLSNNLIFENIVRH